MSIFKRTCTVAVLSALSITMANAQTQANVGVHKDWSVFVSGEGAAKNCWIVSRPTAKTATKGGKTTQVRRGDIFLMVSVRPGDGVKNEVSFFAGYPFKAGSEVELTVGSNRLTMFTGDGDLDEIAWLPTAQDDDRAVSRFRAGARAQIKGLSARGTTTIDTFSLSGFTAAINSAKEKCSA
ncbi:MAG: invasion associated locus B family protein [Pseudomonadota bacterium]